MSLWDASALFIIMVTLAMVPSTSVALVVTRSATLGFPHGAAVALGIVLGDVTFALLAMVGLTAMSELMGALFLGIKYLAGAYLIWFGLVLIKNRATSYSLQAQGGHNSLIASFLAGLFVTLGDIKAIVFYASLFPTVVDMSALTLGDSVTILLVTIVTIGSVKLAYALAAKQVVTMAKGLALEREARVAKVASGSLMMGAGVYLIAKA